MLSFDGGRLTDKQEFFFIGESDWEAVANEFLTQYYTRRNALPRQIRTAFAPRDPSLLSRLLSEQAGRKVTVSQAQRGETAGVAAMASKNAQERLIATAAKANRTMAVLEELRTLLGLPKLPEVIEAYDVSNFGHRESVCGMVVYRNGKPSKRDYKRFLIKQVDGQDDYASMAEAVSRRLARYRQATEEGVRNGFEQLPDLILADGGKGHAAIVARAVQDAGVSIPVFGMVKDSRHRTRAITGDGGELTLSGHQSVWTFVASIQNEVHRWAISYQRQRGQKRQTALTLQKLPGIGEKRAQRLLKEFKSLQALRAAAPEDIAQRSRIPLPVAQALVRQLQQDA